MQGQNQNDKQQDSVETILQGYQVSDELKRDVIELYLRSLSQDQYKNKSEFIRHKLEEKYGRCLSIVLYQIGSNLSYSFLYQDDFLLELKSEDHIILVYLLPPAYTQPPPLIQEPIRRIVEEPPRRVVEYPTSYQPFVSRVYDPRPSDVPFSYSYYPQRFYDGSYRRGYGY
ncbi:hypothetical protein pb186bvf_007013 [Paramecium bursaria]